MKSTANGVKVPNWSRENEEPHTGPVAQQTEHSPPMHPGRRNPAYTALIREALAQAGGAK